MAFECRGQIAIDWFAQIWHVDGGGNPHICKRRMPIQFVLDYDVQRLDEMITEAIHRSGRTTAKITTTTTTSSSNNSDNGGDGDCEEQHKEAKIEGKANNDDDQQDEEEG